MRAILPFVAGQRHRGRSEGIFSTPTRGHIRIAIPMPTAELDLPAFSSIRVANIEPVLRELLDAHRAQLAALLDRPALSWDSLVVPLEEMHHRLSRTWSPVGHMNGVVNSDELRAAYNACLPLLTAWHTELAQNERLYRAYEAILDERGRATDRRTAQAAAERAARLPARRRRVAGGAEGRVQGAGGAAGDAAIEVRRERARRHQRLVAARHRRKASSPDCRSRSSNAHAPPRRRASSEGWFFTLDAPNYQAVMMHGENEAPAPRVLPGLGDARFRPGRNGRPLGQHRS